MQQRQQCRQVYKSIASSEQSPTDRLCRLARSSDIYIEAWAPSSQWHSRKVRLSLLGWLLHAFIMTWKHRKGLNDGMVVAELIGDVDWNSLLEIPRFCTTGEPRVRLQRAVAQVSFWEGLRPQTEKTF
eukprot:g10860.t1